MTSPDKKPISVAVSDVLALLSRVRSGDLNPTQPDTSQFGDLKAVMDEINALAKFFSAQAQATAVQGKENSLVIESLGIGIWKWDLTSNLLEWDENMYRLYGIEKSDFNGAYDAWENSLSAETKAKAVQEINAAVRGEKDFDTTFQVVHKSGKIQELRTRAFVIRDQDGKPLKMHGINVDRSREAELEKAMERERANSVQSSKLASLGEMSAGVAHEINNPLMIILGKARQLRRAVTSTTMDVESVVGNAETIVETTMRIAKIVKGLRSFSRDGRNDAFEPVQIRGLVEGVLGLCQERFKKHGVNLTVAVGADAQCQCRDSQIAQILLNLLNNAFDAIRALPDKWVRLEVRTVWDEFAEFAVIDSGSGIPNALQAKIMEPFFTTKPVGQGTGLGLSISKGIAEDHGGSLTIDNQSPNTRFVLKLPLKHCVTAGKAAA